MIVYFLTLLRWKSTKILLSLPDGRLRPNGCGRCLKLASSGPGWRTTDGRNGPLTGLGHNDLSAWAPLLGRGGDPGRGRAGQRTPPGASRLILGQGKGRPFRGGPSSGVTFNARPAYAYGAGPARRRSSRRRSTSGSDPAT